MEFKLIVAGGRDFADYELLSQTLNQVAEEAGARLISIVSGMAAGADALGYHFAKQHGVTAYAMPADWNRHGKRAGFTRNEDMARFSDGLLAFWDGQSKGTAHMIEFMCSLGKPMHVVIYNQRPTVVVAPVVEPDTADTPPWEGPDELNQ